MQVVFTYTYYILNNDFIVKTLTSLVNSFSGKDIMTLFQYYIEIYVHVYYILRQTGSKKYNITQ